MNLDIDPQSTLSILRFWGKASSSNLAGSATHSIAYHSLDVAAVANELMARDEDRLGRIAAAVGTDVSTLTGVLPFLLTLHDIGKYARVFQAKAPDHWPTNVLGPYREIAPGNSHVITGFQMLGAFSDAGPVQDIFESVMPGWSASERKILFRALAGHHGRPPDEGERSSLGQHDVCTACVAAAQARIQAMFGLMRPTALPRRSKSELIILGVGLFGLFILADWIGSAETWFPYTAPTTTRRKLAAAYQTRAAETQRLKMLTGGRFFLVCRGAFGSIWSKTLTTRHAISLAPLKT
jgi:CRISPR-associated endonuclease/helicase Cas3